MKTNLSGLTKEEQELEKIVEEIKFSPTVVGIGILKGFQNKVLDTAILHLQNITTRGDILYTVSKLKK